jgi:hypothetical protein
MARIKAYFLTLQGADGVAHFRLRVPVKGVSGELGLYIDREVRVDAHRGRDDDNLNDLIRITWNSEGSVIFPVFTGVLIVWGETDPLRSFVELDGEYEPPLGPAGEAFDEVIGHQIAVSTAQAFLADLKSAVE